MWSSRPASSSSSMSSMRAVTPRTMLTSTSAWSRSRCSSSSVLERGASPALTAVRSASTERSGWVRAVTTRRGPTLIHRVEMSEGSKLKSKCTSLMTAISESSARSMRVECSPSLQRLEEGVGQAGVALQPALGLGVAQVEVQPQVGAGRACPRPSQAAAWAESTARTGAGRGGVEQVAADQPGFVAAIGASDRIHGARGMVESLRWCGPHVSAM